MTLTFEQFNQLATKDDLSGIKEHISDMDNKVDLMINSVDGLAKKINDFHAEMASNQAAHDRFENRFTRIKNHLSLKWDL
jgi:peptidoglycan hydrolase CwlO-like protein